MASRLSPSPLLTDVDPRRVNHAAARTGLPVGRPDWLFDNRRELGSSCSDWMISHALPQSMAEVVHYSRNTVSESAMEQLGVLISEATSWPSSREAHDDA